MLFIQKYTLASNSTLIIPAVSETAAKSCNILNQRHHHLRFLTLLAVFNLLLSTHMLHSVF
jgi:hypothetical protein